MIATNEGGKLLQEGDDNADINCQTVDGKGTFHSMARVLFQGQSTMEISEQCSVDRIKVGKDKTLNLSADNTAIMRTVLHYEKPRQWPECPRTKNALIRIKALGTINEPSDSREISWVLLRMASRGFLKFIHDLNQPSNQAIPFWVGFKTMLFEHSNFKTVAVYAPVIESKPADPKTVYTTMVRCKQLTQNIGQENPIQTMDQQLYAVGQQVKWHKNPEFQNTVLRLGGFHTVCCFIRSIGKLFTDAGLKDLLVESGIYAEATVNMMLAGKQFHRSVRGLTLAYEALMQIFLEEFIKWLETHQTSQPTARAVWEGIQNITAKFNEMGKTQFQEVIKKLNEDVTDRLLPLITKFRK